MVNTTSSAVIEINQLTKIYRKSHLGRVKTSIGVENVSFSVGAGEVFGLLGLNGAGKTTTIKLLLGLLRPTSGEIRVFGNPMPHVPTLARIGYLPEAAYLHRSLTGREIVSLYGRLSGIPETEIQKKVEHILQQVGMGKVADKRVSDFSKGMLQRISLAQTLVHDPSLVILDEPISGLDPLAVREMRQLILWLKSQGKTVFFSSHDMSEVEQVCDRVGVMVMGGLARLATRADWQAAGSLETLFTSIVRRSDQVGPLAFGEPHA